VFIAVVWTSGEGGLLKRTPGIDVDLSVVAAIVCQTLARPRDALPATVQAKVPDLVSERALGKHGYDAAP
jgi:hypothetical protein